jgi:AraC-like DNA-binding protein
VEFISIDRSPGVLLVVALALLAEMAMTKLPDRLPSRPDDAEDSGGDAHDVLSDVLSSIRLTGSMFFLVEATTPWRTQAPATRTFARAVMPAAQHLISYHVVTQGNCWGGLAGEEPQKLNTGDILVVPQGDPYFLAEPPDALSAYSDDGAVSFFRRMAAGELPTVVSEGGGGAKHTEFICGFLGCDARPFNPILAALPRVLHLRAHTGERERLSHLVDFALAELRQREQGSREVLLRLSELMFVEVVRRHLLNTAVERPDWLAGLRDPLVARVLAQIHAHPARGWSLKALAAMTGASRSTLAERFLQYVGQPPMHYLIAWRMQLAARQLAEGSAKVRAVAESVGYASEAAFSRAFKKHTGVSPSDWR